MFEKGPKAERSTKKAFKRNSKTVKGYSEGLKSWSDNTERNEDGAPVADESKYKSMEVAASAAGPEAESRRRSMAVWSEATGAYAEKASEEVKKTEDRAIENGSEPRTLAQNMAYTAIDSATDGENVKTGYDDDIKRQQSDDAELTGDSEAQLPHTPTRPAIDAYTELTRENDGSEITDLNFVNIQPRERGVQVSHASKSRAWKVYPSPANSRVTQQGLANDNTPSTNKRTREIGQEVQRRLDEVSL